MKKIALSFICILLLANVFIRTSNAQTDSTFKPSGKFSAQFFGDYYYKLHADSLNRGVGQYSGVPKNFQNYQIRRVYLGYNYDISGSFTTEFLLAYEEGSGASTTLDAAGERSFYLKLANIRWKNIYSNADLIFGAQSTPTYALLSEKIWGYRSIEKTLLDKNKIASATDLGLGLQGAFDDERNFGYDLLYANGTAQKLPTFTQRAKKLYGDLWAKFMEKKIVVQLYGDVMQTQDNPYSKNTSTMKAFAAYTTPMLTLGVEGFLQTNTHAVTDSNFTTKAYDTVNAKQFGFSVFVTGQIIENSLNFFARFDSYNPDNGYVTTVKYLSGENTNKEIFITAGLDWTPYKNVHIMPNIWYNGYSSKVPNTTGFALSDNDVVPRLTVFYKF